jgi:hypothetical protein
MMVRKVFRPRWEDITRAWKNLHNEKLHDLHSSLNTVRVTKSMPKWAGNVAQTGVLVGKFLDKRSLEDVVVVGRAILRMILLE